MFPTLKKAFEPFCVWYAENKKKERGKKHSEDTIQDCYHTLYTITRPIILCTYRQKAPEGLFHLSMDEDDVVQEVFVNLVERTFKRFNVFALDRLDEMSVGNYIENGIRIYINAIIRKQRKVYKKIEQGFIEYTRKRKGAMEAASPQRMSEGRDTLRVFVRRLGDSIDTPAFSSTERRILSYVLKEGDIDILCHKAAMRSRFGVGRYHIDKFLLRLRPALAYSMNVR